MGGLADTLTELVRQYPAWAGILLSLGTVLHGGVTLFIAMYLAVSRALPWREFFMVTIGALIVWEILVFSVGRLIRRTRSGWRWYRKMKSNPRIQFYSHYLREHLTKLLIASHFLIGVNLTVLILTGWSKTPPGKFLRSSFVGVLTWFVTIGTIAYLSLSGLFHLRAMRVFHQVEVGVILVILLVLGVELLFRRAMRKRVMVEEKAKVMGEAIEKKLAPPIKKKRAARRAPAVSKAEPPAVSKAEPPAVSKAEPPAVSKAEPPAVSKTELPAGERAGPKSDGETTQNGDEKSQPL